MASSQLNRFNSEATHNERATSFNDINQLASQLHLLSQQLTWMTERLNVLDSKVTSHNQFPRIPQYHSESDYGASIQLAFRAVKLFFLFLLGFAVACIISASLNASSVVEVLLNLVAKMFAPLVALTFCTIAGAVALESWK